MSNLLCALFWHPLRKVGRELGCYGMGLEYFDIFECDRCHSRYNRLSGRKQDDKLYPLYNDSNQPVSIFMRYTGTKQRLDETGFEIKPKAIAALEAQPGLPESSADFHQQRGVAWDIIDQAINTYNSYMLDDDYQAIRVLREIIEKMRERRDAFLPQPAQPESVKETLVEWFDGWFANPDRFATGLDLRKVLGKLDEARK